MLTLIKEDGSGKVDANSYAEVADADAYHEGHLYATAWTGATNDDKAKALVMATRLIDSQFRFHGTRAISGQALQWPRGRCPDEDSSSGSVPGDVVPKAVVEATCEMGRELLIQNRTAPPPGEGIRYQTTGLDQIAYDKRDKRPIISNPAQAMLVKLGCRINARAAQVPLVRT